MENLHGWIEVDDYLPEEYGDYMILWKRKNSCDPFFQRKIFYGSLEFDPDEGWLGKPHAAESEGWEVEILFWQPLPALPELD